MVDKNKDLIERIKLFCEEKTYCYIRDLFSYNFNGTILEIDLVKQKIRFEDDELGPIPIRFVDIKQLTYSKKHRSEDANN